MQCKEAAELLNRIQLAAGQDEAVAASPLDTPDVERLVDKGFVSKITDEASHLGELERLRIEFGRLQERRPLREAPGEEEARLRSRILELSEAAARVTGSVRVGGQRLALTYAGRTELSMLMTRLGRVADLDLAEFDRQMEALRNSTQARGRRASQILKVLSPKFPHVDEIHLRSASVGLAGARGEPEQLAQSFANAFGSLWEKDAPSWKRSMLAEVIVLSRGTLTRDQADACVSEMSSLVSRVRERYPEASEDDRYNVAALLFPLPDGRRREAMEAADQFKTHLDGAGLGAIRLEAPLVLLASTRFTETETAADWMNWMRARFSERRVPPAEAEMAAAILGSSRGEAGDEMLHQYDRAASYLTRLYEGPTAVGAAMLAVIPTGIEESLDDLRMAASVISANRLSVGGMENLSLGLKLLLQTSVLVGGGSGNAEALQVGPEHVPLLSPLGLTGLAAVVPTAIAALTTFHEAAIHRAAVTAYNFHPVHVNYVYG